MEREVHDVRGRRRYLALGAACALVAAAVAGGIVLVFSDSSKAAPTKAQYFARVATICRIYGPKLDKVPPPTDIAIPGVVASSLGKALPILEAQAAAVHALRPPTELRAEIKRWVVLDNRAIAKLRESLRLAREPNLSQMAFAYIQFLTASRAAKHLGQTIGFPHPPC
jgi:hypothetical protein